MDTKYSTYIYEDKELFSLPSEIFDEFCDEMTSTLTLVKLMGYKILHFGDHASYVFEILNNNGRVCAIEFLYTWGKTVNKVNVIGNLIIDIKNKNIKENILASVKEWKKYL